MKNILFGLLFLSGLVYCQDTSSVFIKDLPATTTSSPTWIMIVESPTTTHKITLSKFYQTAFKDSVASAIGIAETSILSTVTANDSILNAAINLKASIIQLNEVADTASAQIILEAGNRFNQDSTLSASINLKASVSQLFQVQDSLANVYDSVSTAFASIIIEAGIRDSVDGALGASIDLRVKIDSLVNFINISGEGITISANKINILGIIDSLVSKQVEVNTMTANQMYTGGIDLVDGSSRVIITSTGITYGTNPGSGWVNDPVATQSWVGGQGYITGISGSDVTTALGYTPVSGTPWTSEGYIVAPSTASGWLYNDGFGGLSYTFPSAANVGALPSSGAGDIYTHNASEFQVAGSYLTSETDPNISAWARAGTKPSYTYSEVGADATGTASGLMSSHNSTYTHANIAHGETAYGWGNHASAGYVLSSGLGTAIDSHLNWEIANSWYNIYVATADVAGSAAYATNVAWSGVSSKPTTLSGYGITDAATSTHNHTGVYHPYVSGGVSTTIYVLDENNNTIRMTFTNGICTDATTL